MAVSFHNEGTNFEIKQKRRHKKWITEYLQINNRIPGRLTFIFTTNDLLRKINREFLQHNHFTDVITFDYTEGKEISGDIFISIDQVRLNAVEYESAFEKELRRVMIHGVIHLMGHTDKTVKEREAMRKMEDVALNLW